MTGKRPQRGRGIFHYRPTPWQWAALAIVAFTTVLAAILLLLSIWANPSSASSLTNTIILVGLVGAASIGVVGTLVVPLVIRLAEEYLSHRRSAKALSAETDNSERELKPRLRGIQRLILRQETTEVFQQLDLGKSVLLTGEAGIGKSGIGMAVVEEARRRQAFPVLFDARHFMEISAAADFRAHLDIDEPIDEVIARLGESRRLYFVLDQLDNTVGSPCCTLLVNLVIQLTKLEGVSVLVISRQREANEQGALRPLLESGFEEIICRPLATETILDILESVGVRQVPSELLKLASNLLNLELLCEIARERGQSDLTTLLDEIDLWDKYVVSVQERESLAPHRPARDFIIEATRLATIGLGEPDRTFVMNDPPTNTQNRLISAQIVFTSTNKGFRYRFAHEKLQDYLYARHASRQSMSAEQVYLQIDRLHCRNVLLWMLELYKRSNAPIYASFLEELLSG